MAAQTDHARTPGREWTREEIAVALLSRRDALLRQLPRQIRAARSLTADQQEWVIDDAVDHLVTGNEDGVISDVVSLEKAFWTSAKNRVKHCLDGRHNTVRARWKRVSVEDVDVADPSSALPEDVVIQHFEQDVLVEFAAELTAEQHAVLSAKHLGPKEMGRYAIANELGWNPLRVRSCERAIQRRLKKFSAVVAAGSLCDYRQPAIEKLAVGTASPVEYRMANAHLAHCSDCRGTYFNLLRAIKAGYLQREIAQILPVAPALDAVDRHRGPWEIIIDWLSKPFGHDATITAGQLAGAGRGLGGVAAVKLAGLCASGAAAGVFCVAQVPRDGARHLHAIKSPARTATATAPPKRTPAPTVTVAATAEPP